MIIGNISNVITKNLTINKIAAPKVEYSNKWITNDFSIRLIDEINLPEAILKYQYRLEDSGNQWIDINLNQDTVIVDKPGKTYFYVRTVGIEEGDYSDEFVGVAMIDNEGPFIDISVSDNKAIIHAYDSYSEVSEIKYYFSQNEAIEENAEWINYNETPFTYTGNDKLTIYLHIMSKDVLGNTNTKVVKFSAPIAPRVEIIQESTSSKPKFRVIDENNQDESMARYEISLNSGDWEIAYQNQEYDIENSKEGENIVESRTVDAFGRTSSSNIYTYNYSSNGNQSSENDTSSWGYEDERSNPSQDYIIDNGDASNNGASETQEVNNNNTNGNNNNNNSSSAQNSNIEKTTNNSSNTSNNQSNTTNKSESSISSLTAGNTDSKNGKVETKEKEDDEEDDDKEKSSAKENVTYFVESGSKTNSKSDDTVANKKIPKAGNYSVLICTIMVCVCGIVFFVRYKNVY